MRNRTSATISKISEIAHRLRFPNKRNRFPVGGSVFRPSETRVGHDSQKLTKYCTDHVFQIIEIAPGQWFRFSAKRNRASGAISKICDIAHRPCFQNKRNRCPPNGSVLWSSEIAHRPRCPKLAKSRIGRVSRISEIAPRPTVPLSGQSKSIIGHGVQN